MIEIALKNIEKYYAANKVLEDVTFEIQTGEKVGIVGRNGTGKTTIFKLISGMEPFEKGALSIRKGAVIGYLHQIPEFPEHYKVIDVLNSAFEDIFETMEKMRELEARMTEVEGKELERLLSRYGALQATFEHQGGYEVEEKISRVCSGLKMDEAFRQRLFSSLSGGEKTTVMLGKILLQNPDILLLDEPTNHLDIESVEWLEGFIRDYRGTVLIISHDRYFLDKAIGKIIEIEKGRAFEYFGNYSAYAEEKQQKLLNQMKDYIDQQKKIKSMEEAIRRFRLWGTIGDNGGMFKRAANMEKRIEKMEKVEKPQLEQPKMGLSFSEGSRSGKDVIRIRELRKAFGNHVIFENANFHVRYGERVGILGKNGSGKSTLIKMILGNIQADGGEIMLGPSVRIGYLAQEIAFENADATVLQTIMEGCGMSEGQARGILAKFLFFKEDVMKKVINLSGGEKARLRLCQLMLEDINCLLLDEPTNHLDINSREMLEDALWDFEGTLVFISHDRYFINKMADRVVEIRDQRMTEYAGNYDYYKEKRLELEQNLQAQNAGEGKGKSAGKTQPESKKQPRGNKSEKSSENHEKIRRQRAKQLEEEIHHLEDLIRSMDQEIERVTSDYVKLQELCTEKCSLQERLEELLQEWVEM